MTRIRHRPIRTLMICSIGGVLIATIASVAALRRQNVVLPVHARPNVCITKTMMSRIIGEAGFGDWRQHYMVEKSIKASGDYVKRTTTSDGKVELWIAENGEAIQYWLNSKVPATSRPFKAANDFLNENWLAANKELRKENPIVEVLGHKAYVLRHDNGGGSYVDDYIAPDIGEVVMSYHHSVQTTGVLESLISPVTIQVGQLNQDLWNSIPRNTRAISLKRN